MCCLADVHMYKLHNLSHIVRAFYTKAMVRSDNIVPRIRSFKLIDSNRKWPIQELQKYLYKANFRHVRVKIYGNIEMCFCKIIFSQ